MNSARILEWCLRWFVGLVFVYAALTKIMNPCRLALDIYQYHLAPGAIINIAAILLPSVELVFGLCLITGIAPRGAALGISLILVFFMILLTINLIRGIDFECGCFGGSPESDLCHRITLKIRAVWPQMFGLTFVQIRTICDLIRDILFLSASLGSFTLMHKRMKRRRHT
ncbi:MAG: MauE/DoxX family redox-associated membrane protein [bacterium]